MRRSMLLELSGMELDEEFDALHSRTVDDKAVALAFDLLHSGDDIRRQPLIERKKALKWVLVSRAAAFSTLTTPRATQKRCKLGLEGIVSKRLTSVYRSGPSRAWLKTKNPGSPAATRTIDGTF